MQKPRARTAPDLLDELAARQPDAPFLIDGGIRLSYAGFQTAVREHARGLHALGVGKGTRLAILMGNRAEWLVAYFAAMALGAEVVALNTWATARELAYQLDHAKVRWLVLEPRFRDRDVLAILAEAASEHGLDPLPRYLPVEGGPAGAVSFRELPALGAVVDPAFIDAAQRAVRPDDTACILYTSGSTALPKGVPLHHSGLIDNMWAIGERMHLRPGDRLWLGVALFWSYACVNALFAVMTHGGSVVLQHHFEPGEALRLIEAERCTVFYGTPALSRPMLEHPDRPARDLSSLRTGTTIGTPDQVRYAVDLGATEICNVYGLTEAFGNSCVTDAGWPLDKRLACSGPPLDGVAVRIVDPETDTVQPPGAMGEVRIRGYLMKGYLDDPERTAEAFDAEGWLRTGDLGTLDDDGCLTYRGRLKEMVKTGGINVAPAEVEAVLAGHPAVDQAYVTGMPDAALDEALAAVVVLKPGADADEAALEAHCRAALASYKRPRRWCFVAAGALPLTTTGKLQRNRLKDFFEKG